MFQSLLSFLRQARKTLTNQPASCGKAERKVVVDEIEANRILVRGGDGSELVIQSSPNGVSLGIGKPHATSELLCLYRLNGRSVIGLYGPHDTDGLAIALATDDEGEPFLQMIGKDNEPVNLSLELLRKVADEDDIELDVDVHVPPDWEGSEKLAADLQSAAWGAMNKVLDEHKARQVNETETETES